MQMYAPKTRTQLRYDHAYISLKVQINDTWHWVKALHWNEIGFNFFFEEALASGTSLSFKKGNTLFTGKVVWQRQEITSKDLIDMALNMILLEQLLTEYHQKDPVLVHEIIDLVRDSSRTETKIDYCKEHFGLSIAQEDLKTKIVGNQWSELGQVGIEVDSGDWSSVVREALTHSEGIMALDEKNSKTFENLFKSLNRM